MPLSFFSTRAAQDAQVIPWTGRSRVLSAAAVSAGELIPRLVERRLDLGVVEGRGARHGPDGGAVRDELDRDVLDAGERGELLRHGLDAVPARHSDDGQCGGAGHL